MPPFIYILTLKLIYLRLWEKLTLIEKKEELRHKNDFYPTPKCLTWELLKTGELDDVHKVLEPCFEEGAISNILKEAGFSVTERDLNQGNDFLKDDYSNEHYDAVITNPPFDLWDKFVEKSKTIADKVILIGRTNYFGAHRRNINGLWEHLKCVSIFDRQISYESEFREDGKVKCGALVTGWFVFDKEYNDDPTIKILDMQKYILNKNDD